MDLANNFESRNLVQNQGLNITKSGNHTRNQTDVTLENKLNLTDRATKQGNDSNPHSANQAAGLNSITSGGLTSQFNPSMMTSNNQKGLYLYRAGNLHFSLGRVTQQSQA